MLQLRTAVKLTFALLAVLLGLVWAGLLPRPAFLPPELDIEPLTFLLGTIAALLFGFWKNPDSKSEALTASHRLTEPDESLQAEIRKYLKSRYEHRIRQKLAGREPVNLRKIPSSTGTSDEAAQNFITLPAEKVPSGMAELFDEARGRLLVVGTPGAGKTTLLLQLALALLERPGKDLPVLLNLATWRSEFATFDDWLQRILPLELGASKALAEKIRRNTPLILLLDGLDEVPEDARASCLKAIGEYGAEAKHRFVISSRIAEYAATQDAPVYLEVEVQPLTPQQVVDNLTAYVFHQPEAKPLLNALQTDSLLREAVANPFYLNTAQLLFATGRKYSDFGFAATDVAGRQQELEARFVEDALGRKVRREYPKERARKWLGFLAEKMEEEGKARFELVDMQPNFLNMRIHYFVLVGLLYGALGGFLIGIPILNWDIGLFFFILICGFNIVVGIVGHFLPDKIPPTRIETIEVKFWKWHNMKESLGDKLTTSIIMFIGLICLELLENGFSVSSILAAGITIALFLIFSLISSGIVNEKYLKVESPYQRFIASLKYWNLAILNHGVLRLLLSLESSLPLRLVTFLNEMSLRHLLEFDGDPMTGKGGGSWRWRHRIIQEYFLSASAKATADKEVRGERSER